MKRLGVVDGTPVYAETRKTMVIADIDREQEVLLLAAGEATVNEDDQD